MLCSWQLEQWIEESRERLAYRTRPMGEGVHRADYYGVMKEDLACSLDELLLLLTVWRTKQPARQAYPGEYTLGLQ